MITEARTGEILLEIARATIARELGRSHPAHEEGDWLWEAGASFVTLKQAERLRGCIGTLKAHRPLIEDVKSNARNAAFRDPRFPPLSSSELDRTRIEISVLSPLERIVAETEAEALAQLRPGVDGVVFEYGYHQSTYLPQVWQDLQDPVEFLATLKQKAGLPPDFWDVSVKLARYTVSKWSEHPNV
jgi:AmmeMemoRadiSam system protein A